MGYRTDNYGRGQALENDKTTTGARCIASITDSTEFGRRILRVGDKTTPCPKCGKQGVIVSGEERVTFHGVPAAVHGSKVHCDCPPGSNRVIAPAGQWLGRGRDPVEVAREEHAARLAAEKEAEEKRREEERERNRIFAKSCLRGEGCNDAGDQREPHTNFADMAFFQAMPASDPATDSDTPQHARTAKKKKPDDIPKPKKRSALYRWWNGNHEEMDYQAAVAAAAAASRAQTATAGASLLELISGRALTYGTWAVRGAAGLGETATAGAGASVAGLLVGMMPGRLNDGEQDFIDRMRLEQMREAPSRVRYTWENDSSGNAVPRGWHTPPGRDSVRVRKMEYDSSAQAYTFTTEEEPHIIIVWTPDRTDENKPWNTGNQARPVLPNPVIVDPLPDNTGITATTSPAPEEKRFADYILILPFPDLPPIYIYLRHNPGQVTGKGKKVSGVWLSDADKGDGSPIPEQIADRLRGRSFTNFDRFREAFWQEVARDPELSRQFNTHNLANLQKGKAPVPCRSGWVGRRGKFEIHHVRPIAQGGEVYNVDNMSITTPKRHIELHLEK
ncbi:S-type pyocin domain-containing protein [Enterobacter bugandensis]|uniref:S-type pyocin domain-containing protein n=2 Tax=Enterobacter bugandensis TaxID=881260 RepID=UPI001888FAB0|nr:S-type pyocin domain-containing protein [Enterobacter bugandensis]MBF2748926.1 S-type pyocin domain-containing protein [Enterobacter bugandensis]MBF2801574.1 S-type pyocin domain-containing protein [Enterobacter bugandensis]UQQ29783.1 S-type pyocin domain-containing protein [Enterobacter bugandensis]